MSVLQQTKIPGQNHVVELLNLVDLEEGDDPTRVMGRERGHSARMLPVCGLDRSESIHIGDRPVKEE